MTIWDSLGERASKTTAKAVQQARIISETTKLNGLIADEETAINDRYCQIGKMYYMLHQDDPKSEFVEMFASVAASKEKIRMFQVKLQDVRGIVRCEKCGTEVVKGAAFCSSCGAAIPSAKLSESEEVHKCSNCGAKIETYMRFCTSCGKPVAECEDMQQNECAERRICPKCKTQIDGNALFCTECGSKIEEQNAQ